MPTLNWIGKDKVVNHAAAVPFHVLEHKYNFGGETQNRIIHGDNLLALKSLLPEYEGRVKCIYIDPPYNTGNFRCAEFLCVYSLELYQIRYKYCVNLRITHIQSGLFQKHRLLG